MPPHLHARIERRFMVDDVGQHLLRAQRGLDGVGDQFRVVAAAFDGRTQRLVALRSGFPHSSILPCPEHPAHPGRACLWIVRRARRAPNAAGRPQAHVFR